MIQLRKNVWERESVKVKTITGGNLRMWNDWILIEEENYGDAISA